MAYFRGMFFLPIWGMGVNYAHHRALGGELSERNPRTTPTKAMLNITIAILGVVYILLLSLVRGTQSTNLFGFPPFSTKHPQDNFSLQNVNWHPPKGKSAISNLRFLCRTTQKSPLPNLDFGGFLFAFWRLKLSWGDPQKGWYFGFPPLRFGQSASRIPLVDPNHLSAWNMVGGLLSFRHSVRSLFRNSTLETVFQPFPV